MITFTWLFLKTLHLSLHCLNFDNNSSAIRVKLYLHLRVKFVECQNRFRAQSKKYDMKTKQTKVLLKLSVICTYFIQGDNNAHFVWQPRLGMRVFSYVWSLIYMWSPYYLITFLSTIKGKKMKSLNVPHIFVYVYGIRKFFISKTNHN